MLRNLRLRSSETKSGRDCVVMNYNNDEIVDVEEVDPFP
jgi:hypothetical protein